MAVPRRWAVPATLIRRSWSTRMRSRSWGMRLTRWALRPTGSPKKSSPIRLAWLILQLFTRGMRSLLNTSLSGLCLLAWGLWMRNLRKMVFVSRNIVFSSRAL